MTPLRAWNRFWFGPISARPLGAFRILFGLIVLAHLALLWPESDLWLSDAGYLQGSEARELAGPLRPSPLQWVQDPVSVRAFLAATAVVAILFTLGWHTRPMAILLYLMLLSIHHRLLLTTSGADCMLVIASFSMMLSPCGAAYSLDARRAARRRGTMAEPLIVPWAVRLLQIQVCILYFMSAFLKSNGTTWPDGTAVHWILNNGEVRRFTFGLEQCPLLTNAMTHAALLVEFALPFLLWFRETRPWIALLGVGLHFGILLTVNIPIFGELMTSCYLLFLTPDEFDTLLHRVNPRRWFRRPPSRAKADTKGASILRGPHRPVMIRARSGQSIAEANEEEQEYISPRI
ncbi:MAG: HTTM domain-containing protein [Isosphaeraceae bacterium]|nr:HTTM domain-containing protein [Isosphaeraceae bacterium]